jgi:hypothetical protein
VSAERLITILEEIRDQQKQQIANYERVMSLQDEAMALQRRGRRTLLFLIIMPWAFLVTLLIIQLLGISLGAVGVF